MSGRTRGRDTAFLPRSKPQARVRPRSCSRLLRQATSAVRSFGRRLENRFARQSPRDGQQSEMRRRGGDDARVGVRKSAGAANEVRKSAAEQHQRNGRTIRVERAKVTVMTGLARKQNGKAARWFVKTSAVVLQNHCGAFCKPLRWFPVLMRISARSPAHRRPFWCASSPISLRISACSDGQGNPL